MIFPRRKIYGEHGTDHQVEILRAIEEWKDDHIFIVYEEEQPEANIAEVLTRKQKAHPVANVGRANLIRAIRAFIQDQNEEGSTRQERWIGKK